MKPLTQPPPTPDPASLLMSGIEVADLYHVTPQTVIRWAEAGLLGCVRTPGGHRRYFRSEVNRGLSPSGSGLER